MIAIKKAALSAAVAVGMTLAGGTAVAYAAPSGGQQAGHDHDKGDSDGKGDPSGPPTKTPPPPPSGGDKDHNQGWDKDHNPGPGDHNPGPGDHRPGPGDHGPGDDHGRPGHPDPRHDHPVGDWRHDHPDWRFDHSRSHPGWHWYVNKGWWAGAVNARACRIGGGDPDFRHDECDGGRFDDWLLIR